MRWFCNAIRGFLLFTAAVCAGAPSDAAEITILALGTSLTAGYGLGPDDAFPDQLEHALKAAGQDVAVTNAGVSGDTSAGGRNRLGWLLAGASPPDVVIVELGANDGLRAIHPASTRANLAAIIEESQTTGAVVLLTGMLAPPNLGGEYGDVFNHVFPSLAEEYNVVFYPFFLDGVAGNTNLNQADGIHPTPAGVGIIIENIMPSVIAALAKLK
jgi:acyl-CoA thioesterase-1